MCRYQTANPFRKTLMENVPFLLLLKVIKRLKDEDKNGSGIFRQELSFFISWPNADDEDVQRSLQAGMNAHLSKPVEPDLLYKTLEELIYKREHNN